jgi:hypothetical protein
VVDSALGILGDDMNDSRRTTASNYAIVASTLALVLSGTLISKEVTESVERSRSEKLMQEAMEAKANIVAYEACVERAVKLGKVKGFTRTCQKTERERYALVLRDGDPPQTSNEIVWYGRDYPRASVEDEAERRAQAQANPSAYWSPAVIDGWNLQYLERAEKELQRSHKP